MVGLKKILFFKFYKSLFILLFLALTSCFNGKKLYRPYKNEDTIQMPNKFSLGVGPDSNNIDFIWKKFYESKTFKCSDVNVNPKDFIVINYNPDKKLTVTLNDTLGVKSAIHLKAKKRNGYLSLKRNLELIPIPFLFYFHNENKTILILKNNEIKMVSGNMSFGWIFGMANGLDSIESTKIKSTFIKLN